VTGIVKRQPWEFEILEFQGQGQEKGDDGHSTPNSLSLQLHSACLLTDDNFFVSAALVEAQKRTFAIPS